MQFADTVIDQLWEVWRISQVDKCEKVRTGDSGMGHRPLHTLISLECELWPLQVLRQILEVHFYPCNADPSQRAVKHKVKKLILCLFTQYQNQPDSTERFLHGKNWYMTWQQFVNIFHFLFLLNDLNMRILFLNKVEQSMKKACFCSYSVIEQPWELKSQCLFKRSSNRNDWTSRTNTKQRR